MILKFTMTEVGRIIDEAVHNFTRAALMYLAMAADETGIEATIVDLTYKAELVSQGLPATAAEAKSSFIITFDLDYFNENFISGLDDNLNIDPLDSLSVKARKRVEWQLATDYNDLSWVKKRHDEPADIFKLPYALKTIDLLNKNKHWQLFAKDWDNGYNGALIITLDDTRRKGPGFLCKCALIQELFEEKSSLDSVVLQLGKDLSSMKLEDKIYFRVATLLGQAAAAALKERGLN